MFRCWPEDSPVHWGGSDDPTEGGRKGGCMAGGGLPLNFQHRSVQDRMSTSFCPSCLYSVLKGSLPQPNIAVTEMVGKMTYLMEDTLASHHVVLIISWISSCLQHLWLVHNLPVHLGPIVLQLRMLATKTVKVKQSKTTFICVFVMFNWKLFFFFFHNSLLCFF